MVDENPDQKRQFKYEVSQLLYIQDKLTTAKEEYHGECAIMHQIKRLQSELQEALANLNNKWTVTLNPNFQEKK